jgi:hypothetical protein
VLYLLASMARSLFSCATTRQARDASAPPSSQHPPGGEASKQAEEDGAWEATQDCAFVGWVMAKGTLGDVMLARGDVVGFCC